MAATQLRIPRPKQLEELWNNLSDLPPPAINEIRTITRAFDAADEYLKDIETVPDGMKSPLVGYYSSIFEAACVLQAIMSDTSLIKSGCVEEPDRNTVLYGSPEDDN
jgi:hypothetical protein